MMMFLTFLSEGSVFDIRMWDSQLCGESMCYSPVRGNTEGCDQIAEKSQGQGNDSLFVLPLTES